MTCACLIHGNSFEARFGGIGVEVEHHRVGAGAERRGDRCIGRMQLAGDGNPLHAKAGGHGEMLDAAGQRVIDLGRLAADDGAIDDGAAEKQRA